MSQTDETLANAMRTWRQDQQDAAVEMVKPLADEGEPAALLLICWFLHQLGPPRAQEGVLYAKRAAEEGNPWIVQFYFPLLADDPATRPDAAALIASSPMRGVGTNDPIGRAVNFANDGDTINAASMLRAAAAPNPWAQPPDIEDVRRRVAQLDQAIASVGEKQQAVINTMQAASEEVENERENLKTRGRTLTELLNNLTNASSQSHFDEQATKYERESRLLWGFGVFVLMSRQRLRT